MGFDVAPTPVRRRGSSMPAVAVLLASAAVVAFALWSTAAVPTKEPARSPAASGALVAVVASAAPSIARSSPVPSRAPASPLRLPATIECHDLGSMTCGELARATVAILPADGPPILGIEAWGSILCGDTIDCPPQRFVGYQPLGSTVVSFMASEIRAWVNVVEPAPFPGRVWDPTRTVAWIVRWRP